MLVQHESGNTTIGVHAPAPVHAIINRGLTVRCDMNYNEWWHGFDLAKITKVSAIRIEDRDRDGAHTVVQFYRDEDGTWEYQDYETPYGGSGWTGEVVRGGDGLSDESVLNRLNGFADAYHFMYRE